MPLEQKYYNDPAAVAHWLDNPAHPPEARGALVDYTLCCAVRAPHFYVKNFGEITTEFIQPAMDQIWNNQATAQEALRQATANAAPRLAGRWDR
jgi:multiple sugar transport system substrate-binding protein